MAHDVFISYRRDGGLDLAGRIKDHLVLAGYNPFYDVETMKSGRFDKQLYEKIDECKHFLLILPPKGLNRCRNNNDWVRKEVEYAIRQKKHIITVLMPGFTFPKRLPPSIDVIRYVQAVVPTPETFEHTVEKIVEYLKDQNWSPVEYDIDITQESVSPFRKAAPFVALFVVFSLAIGLFLWHPWNSTKTDTIKDIIEPVIKIESPIIADDNNSVSFVCNAEDDTGIEAFDLSQAQIITKGFSANIVIEGNGLTKDIKLTDISGGRSGYIIITEGAAVDSVGNKSMKTRSVRFDLDDPDSDCTPPAITISPAVSNGKGEIKYTVSTNDNVGVVFFGIHKDNVIMRGFSSKVLITDVSEFVKEITFSEIESTSDLNQKYFTLTYGVSRDAMGNENSAKNSPTFQMSDLNHPTDNTHPTLNIGKFDSEKVCKGGSMLCTIYFADNSTILEDNITPNNIELDSGWTAEIEVFSSNQKKVIEFRNIQGMIGYHHFTIKEGAVSDSNGNKSKSVQSFEFYLMNNDSTEPTIVITKPKFTDDGDIKFSIYVDDDTSLETFSVDPEKIILIGFEGDISIIPSSQVDACTISITNYKKLSDECYVVIPAGVAKDKAGNQTRAIKSASFKIEE